MGADRDLLAPEHPTLNAIKEWVAKADAAMGHTEHWIDDGLPALEPEDLTQVRDELRRSLARESARSHWIAVLVERVERAESVTDAKVATVAEFMAHTFPSALPVGKLSLADVREIVRAALAGETPK